MKTNVFLILAAFIYFPFFGCKQTPPDPTVGVKEVLPVVVKKLTSPTQDDTITVDTALAWINKWNREVNNGGGYMGQYPLYAFDIPQEDFTNIFNETGAKTVRFYMGIREGTTEYKVAVVGVDSNGNDMINPAKGEYVYDLSTPCPPLCDTSSVLYDGSLFVN